jgi:hypothetical protein
MGSGIGSRLFRAQPRGTNGHESRCSRETNHAIPRCDLSGGAILNRFLLFFANHIAKTENPRPKTESELGSGTTVTSYSHKSPGDPASTMIVILVERPGP